MTTPMHGEWRKYTVVLVHRRRPRDIWYIRAYPESAINPSPAQIDVRIRFGETARRARGIKWRELGVPMPLASLLVASRLKGYRSPYAGRRRVPKWVRMLAEWYGPETVRRALALEARQEGY